MSRKDTETPVNLYYMNNGQTQKETIDDMMKRKKTKEREKRIKENKKKRQENDFDFDTETVINMTNKNNIKKEEANRKKITKQERKRKKRIKRIKRMLTVIIILGLTIGGFVFALTSPIFNIQEIKVINNNLIPAETIISLSGLTTEKNIFKFYKTRVIDKIKENAYVEDVQINRKYPNAIIIDVKERKESYIIEHLGKYAYINTQGYILAIKDEKTELPIIKGLNTKEEAIIPGNRLNIEDLIKLEDIIKINNSTIENGLGGKITSIDIKKKNEYSIFIESEKKTIYIGDANNLSNKMLYVLAIMKEEKDKEGFIYVNGDLNNKFQPYFREKV